MDIWEQNEYTVYHTKYGWIASHTEKDSTKYVTNRKTRIEALFHKYHTEYTAGEFKDLMRPDNLIRNKLVYSLTLTTSEVQVRCICGRPLMFSTWKIWDSDKDLEIILCKQCTDEMIDEASEQHFS